VRHDLIGLNVVGGADAADERLPRMVPQSAPAEGTGARFAVAPVDHEVDAAAGAILAIAATLATGPVLRLASVVRGGHRVIIGDEWWTVKENGDFLCDR
jgi:hypothetical protein